MSKKHRAIPIRGNEVTRKVWKKVPYDEMIQEIKAGRGIFVEGIKRQTASYAAKKLSKMMGRKVIQCPVFVKLRGQVLDGYSFELEGSEPPLSSRQKNTSAFSP